MTTEVENFVEVCRGCVEIRRSDWSLFPGGNEHRKHMRATEHVLHPRKESSKISSLKMQNYD